MAQRHTIFKTLGLVMAGALLVAACGGGDSDSRTRNAAPGESYYSDCWVTQQAKDELLKTLGAELEQAIDAAMNVRAAATEYNTDARAAREAYDEYLLIGDRAPFEAANAKAFASYTRWQALQEQADRLLLLNDQVARESSKPLCGTQPPTQEITQETTESSTTSTTAQSGDAGSLGINDISCLNSYVMKSSLTVGETTTVGIVKCGNLQGVITLPDTEPAVFSSVPGQTDTEFVWTLQALVPGTHKIELFHIDPQTSEEGVKQSYTIEVTGKLLDPSTASPTTSVAAPPTTSTTEEPACGLPVPREGRDFIVDKGATITFTVDLCDQWSGVAVGSSNWPDTVLEQYSNEGGVTTQTVRFPNVGAARLGFIGYQHKTDSFLTDTAWVNVTVRDPSAKDPCEGKAPEGSWNPDVEGGSFTAASTCDGITMLKVVVDRVVGDERIEVFNGYMASGLGHVDLIQCFGEGTYRVYLRHVTRASVDDNWRTLGDAGWLDVTYTPPRGGTVSNGAAPLPTAVFQPTVTEAPANPRDVSPSVPVVAVPVDSPVLTCDQACIDSLVTRVGATNGTVEIAFGEADFEKVSARGSFVAPLSATSVRVRVTPTDGEPVTMAAVFTRDSVNEAYADVAMEEVRTDLAPVASDSGTSFPWWIVAVVIVVLLAAGEAVRRRRKAETAHADA